jgi:ABC-type molybdate transport system substrate-binding protein
VADTESNSVEGIVTKIELGEIDAGLVYSSDCVAASQRPTVQCVVVPDKLGGRNLNDFTTYSAMMMSDKPTAREFFGMVTSVAFVSTLTTKFGFSE